MKKKEENLLFFSKDFSKKARKMYAIDLEQEDLLSSEWHVHRAEPERPSQDFIERKSILE